MKRLLCVFLGHRFGLYDRVEFGYCQRHCGTEVYDVLSVGERRIIRELEDITDALNDLREAPKSI